MNQRTVLLAAALGVSLVGASLAPAQGVIASSGFNDQSGMNSNPTPNSPYQLGQTVHDFGAGEPGWTSLWNVTRGGGMGGHELATVQGAAAREGDGGLSLEPSEGTRALRTFPLQSRTFVIEQDINFVGAGDLVSRPAYDGYNEPAQFGPMWMLSGPVDARHFYVADGTGNGIVNWEDTGIVQRAGQWQRITVGVDVINQTWNFGVDGTTFVSPDPLGFTGNPPGINFVEYLTTSSGYIDSVMIRAVPEPSAFAICALGAAALLGRGKRATRL